MGDVMEGSKALSSREETEDNKVAMFNTEQYVDERGDSCFSENRQAREVRK